MINPPLIYNDQWIEDALRVAQAAKHAHVPRFKEKFGPPTVEGMLLELKRLREESERLLMLTEVGEAIVTDDHVARHHGQQCTIKNCSMTSYLFQVRVALAPKQEK